MRTKLLHAALFAVLAGGCVESLTGTATVEPAADVEVDTPEMVELSPGVEVVSDFGDPVFYSDNMYWRFNNGVWYSSRYHTRGWVRVEDVPVGIRHIDRPAQYVHYHARAGQRVVARQHHEPPARHPAEVRAPEHRAPEHREPEHRAPEHRPPPAAEHREAEHRPPPAAEHREAEHRPPPAAEHREAEHRPPPAAEHHEAEHREPVVHEPGEHRESGAMVPEHDEHKDPKDHHPQH